MPRNSQGLYTLPLPPVVPNTLIESQWANPTLDDIASALTASLPRDGSAPMTGALTLAAGAPTNSRHATSKAYVDSFMAYATGMPIGSVFAFAPNVAPAGYLLCDGAAVSRTTYADLFAAIGTTFGSGDGIATFNVPDMRDWFIRGRGTGRTVGSTQAASLASHVHAISDPGHTHFASQVAHQHAIGTNPHSHTVSDPGHTHIYDRTGAVAGPSVGASAGWLVEQQSTGSAQTGITVDAAGDIGGSTDAQQPGVTVASAVTGAQIGAFGGTETRPQNIALDYYIKAVNDSLNTGIVTGVDTSDPQMIDVDVSNPVTPVLDIQANLPFGIPKLDANGHISLQQLPAGAQSFLGTFDCSGGQNPSQKYPTTTFIDGNTYLVAIGGTITVYNPATNTAAPTVIDLGWNLVWIQNSNQPVGWYFIESAVVTAAVASSVAFVPGGTIAATNVQAAINELDNETQASLATKANLGNTVPGMDGTASAGTALEASRTDHVHPTDTSRAPTSAGTAVGTSCTPTGNIAATNVQAAITELDSEKLGVGANAAGVVAGGVNQAAIGNNVVGKGPAFRATGATVAPVVNVATKVPVQTEVFDTNNNYDAPNSRFTPTVPGYYQLNCSGGNQSALDTFGLYIALLKNGSTTLAQGGSTGNASTYAKGSASAVEYFNGTTDYVEVYITPTGPSGTLNVICESFSGALVRAG